MQFLGRREEKEWQLRKIGLRMVIGQIQGDQTHIHRVRVFLRPDSFVVARKKQLLKSMIGLLK